MATGKYERLIKFRLNAVKKWRNEGDTEETVAKKLGISLKSLTNYKKKHPEFVEALDKDIDDLVGQIEQSLLQQAMGFDEVKIIEEFDGENNLIKKTKQTIKKAGNVTAAIFILKNRMPDVYSDKIEIKGDTDILKQIKEFNDSQVKKTLKKALDNTHV